MLSRNEPSWKPISSPSKLHKLFYQEYSQRSLSGQQGKASNRKRVDDVPRGKPEKSINVPTEEKLSGRTSALYMNSPSTWVLKAPSVDKSMPMSSIWRGGGCPAEFDCLFLEKKRGTYNPIPEPLFSLGVHSAKYSNSHSGNRFYRLIDQTTPVPKRPH